MKKYVEITLLPDAEIEIYFLWEKLYQQLHLAFVEAANSEGLTGVGVSFPKYNQKKRWLGDQLRLFAQTENELEALNLPVWLERLADYIHVKNIKDVPSQVSGYAFFKRLSDKSNVGKLARRRAKNLGISLDEARMFFDSDTSREQPKNKVTDYPFISLRSLSSNSKYPVTIVQVQAESLVIGDGFSTYGLSVDRLNKGNDSSVPIFR